MENNIISTRIKELRTSKGLTQAEFSESINTTQAALSGYERGDRTPSLDVLICIAQKYDVSVDWLCGLSETKKLSSSLETYTDLIKLLILIDETPEVSMEFRFVKSPIQNFFSRPCRYLHIDINDSHIADFYEEWQDISSIRQKSPSGEKLYNIWLKDIYERFNFPLENAIQIEELPFS